MIQLGTTPVGFYARPGNSVTLKLQLDFLRLTEIATCCV